MTPPPSEYHIKPTQDRVFEALFAKEKNADVLVSLLNGLLELPKEKQITKIEHLLPQGELESPEEKRFVMDLFVKDAKGERYGVEMQVQNHDGFTERMLFYACRRYGEQLKRAEDYTGLKALVLIVIVDFNLFPETAAWKEKFQLMGKTDGQVFSEHLSIVLVELKKFKKSIEEAANLGEKWILFLKEGTKMQAEIKDPAWMTPELKKAIEELERMEGDEGQRALYEARQREIQIQATLLKDRFNQGSTHATRKIAMRMMSEGDSLERIARLTGLELEELQSMREAQN